MFNKLILWLSLIVPWFTLFFMKKESIKRYMPVTILTALLVTVVYEMGYSYRWWQITEKIVPWGHITNVSMAYGSFFIVTLWVFYFTFKKFWLYLMTNIIIDGVGSFFILELFEMRKMTHLIISNLSIFLIMISLSLITYGFQVWYQKV